MEVEDEVNEMSPEQTLSDEITTQDTLDWRRTVKALLNQVLITMAANQRSTMAAIDDAVTALGQTITDGFATLGTAVSDEISAAEQAIIASGSTAAAVASLQTMKTNVAASFSSVQKTLQDETNKLKSQTGPTNTVPDPPINVVATAGDSSASVSFDAPANTGGSSITNYTVTGSDGSSANGTSSPVNVTGLTNGVPITFTVAATNSTGTSVPSGVSNSVTPTAPGV